MQLRLPDSTLSLAGPAKVMGILNVTPDSFSDGGDYMSPAAAVDHARRMIRDGAVLIDIGGESTRPGSDPVPPAEQIRRVIPVLEQLRSADAAIPISIDTRSARVAEAALDAGANIINDVSALRDDPEIATLAAEKNVPVILMHSKGTPRNMQKNPVYQDVVREVVDFLAERKTAAQLAGVADDRIIIDPGLGFGKTTRHNFQLIRHLDTLGELGVPVLLGPSRKRFLGEALGVDDPSGRVFGTAAVAAVAIQRGVRILRAHDVKAMVQVAAICHRIHTATEDEP